jgi:archaellum biogenesis protein FlaJ (TadC family)
MLMSHSTSQVLQLLSVFAAFVSAMALYYGSLGVPFERQSYGGVTPTEIAIKRRQTIMTRVGIPSAFVALIVQVVVVIFT